MRFERIDFFAFGPFTNQSLDFSAAGGPGLHLIQGPNEAGKTSARRGTRQLLYGIDERTIDNFLHENKSLRLGAALVDDDGSRIVFERKKGRKRFLVNSETGQEIDQAEIDRFLGGVDANTFEKMFALGRDELVEGGEAILEGAGDLGKILFAAGGGLAGLERVLKRLEDEAEELFSSRKSKPSINKMIREYQDTQKSVRSRSLKIDEYDARLTALDRAVREKERLDAEWNRLRGERRRLERIKNALTAIADWKSLRAEFEPIRGDADLPLDDEITWVEIDQNFRVAVDRIERGRAELAEIESRIAKIVVPEDLLKIEDTLKGIGDEPALVRSAAARRDKLAIECTLKNQNARDLLLQYRPEVAYSEVDSLRLSLETDRSIVRLIEAKKSLDSELKLAEKQLDKEENEYNKLKDEFAMISVPPDAIRDRLKGAIEHASRLGAIERDLEAKRVDAAKSRTKGENALAKIGLWRGSIDAIESLETPPVEVVRRFANDFKKYHDQILSFKHEMIKLSELKRDAERDLDVLKNQGEVPTERDLIAARERRDELWRAILTSWEGSIAATLEASRSLVERYRASVDEADEIADRLRRESDRVARFAEKSADLKRIAAADQEKSSLLRSSEAEFERLRDEWITGWKAVGIDEPRDPEDMAAWLVEFDKIRALAESTRGLETEANALAFRLEDARNRLIDSLAAAELAIDRSSTFEQLLEQAKAYQETISANMTSRVVIQKKFESQISKKQESATEAAKKRDELEVWKTEWRRAIEPLGISTDASTEVVKAMLDKLSAIFAERDEARKDENEIAQIDDDMKRFAELMRSIAERVAVDLVDREPFDIAAALIDRLAAARKAREDYDREIQARDNKRAAIAKAEITRDESRLALDRILRRLECDSADRLPETLGRIRRARELDTRIKNREQDILKESSGKSLDAFVAEVEAETTDVDDFDARIEALDERIQEIESNRDLAIAAGAREHEWMQLNTDGEGAAGDRQRLEEIRAAIALDVDRYATIKPAQAILRKAIERYRERNQGPVVKHASNLFRSITLGSFEELRVDYDEKDKPVLVGVRRGAVLTVDQMSEGTRDQLYLALRLASLVEIVESRENPPFLVDDILVNFDDERAGATLDILADLARETQVLFFTHHEHLIEIARKRLDSGVYRVHRLGAG